MLRKKKLIVLLISVFVLISTVQVYAAAALDSDIITLIREGITEIKIYYSSQSESEIDVLKTQYQEDINEFIGNKAEEFEGKLKEHKDNEVNRANQELTNYINETKTALSNEIDLTLDEAKENITNKVNEKIETSKNDIKEIFKSVIKEKLKPNN